MCIRDRSVTVGKLRMCATGYCSALHAWDHLGQPPLEAMDETSEDFSVKNDTDRTTLILSLACRNYHLLSIIKSMWSARFY